MCPCSGRPITRWFRCRSWCVTEPNDDKITITGVTQDEPTNGLGDGDTPIDATVQVNAATVDDSVLLRSERSGNGNGRVYHVCFHIMIRSRTPMECEGGGAEKQKDLTRQVDGGGTTIRRTKKK